MALVLLLLRRTQQNSQGWYFAWENLQEVFVMLVVVVVVFPHWRFLRFRATFPCHRDSTRLLRLVKVSTGSELYPGCFWLLYFLPGFFVTVLPLALRFWVGIFYPQTFFNLTLLHRYFVTFCDLDADRSNPLTTPSKTHGLELLIL